MNLDRIINSIYTFIVYQPLISLGIAAAVGILIYIKPKQVLRAISSITCGAPSSPDISIKVK